jgi:hypothetical protein
MFDSLYGTINNSDENIEEKGGNYLKDSSYTNIDNY